MPNGPCKSPKNALYRSTAPLIRNCGKKVYVPSVKRPLKLTSFARPLDRLCSAEPPKKNSFNQGLSDFFQGANRTLPVTSTSFVVEAVKSPWPLKMPTQYCARPPAKSPWISMPGARKAPPASGYNTELMERSPNSTFVSPVPTSIEKGTLY